MYLLEICENIDILRLIYFARRILNIAFVIIPIALIVILIIDLMKIVISGEEKEASKSTKTIISRLIYFVLLFFVPTIVGAVMNLVENSNISDSNKYNLCMQNTTKERFEQLNKEAIEKEEQEKNDKDGHNNNDDYKEPTSEEKTRIATSMISKAESQKGIKEEPDGSNYTIYHKEYNVAKNTQWCGLFVTWVAKNTKLSDGGNLFDSIINKENHPQVNYYSVDNTISYFKNDSHLEYHSENDYIPKKGDYIFFNHHVGIVTAVKEGYVTTVEGNSENKVSSYTYKISDDKIIGYGSWY